MGSFSFEKTISGFLLFFSPLPIPALSQKGLATEKKKEGKPPKNKKIKKNSSSDFSGNECKVSQSQFLHKIEYFNHNFLQ